MPAAALVWNDGSLKLHSVETLDPSKLDAWILRWAGDSRPFDPLLYRVPPTALAVIAVHVDATALHDAIRMLVPEPDQPRLANFETILSGLLLGQDVQASVLPRLGPGAIAYLDSPGDILEDTANSQQKLLSPSPLPLVLVVGMEGRGEKPPASGEHRQNADGAGAHGATVGDALDNAMRTLLAALALAPERAQGRAKITTRTVAGVAIHTLDFPISFAYAIDRGSGRAILSTSTDAIARYLKHATDLQAGARFRRFQAVGFSNAQTFACIDLDAINRLASRHRDRVVGALAAHRIGPSRTWTAT